MRNRMTKSRKSSMYSYRMGRPGKIHRSKLKKKGRNMFTRGYAAKRR